MKKSSPIDGKTEEEIKDEVGKEDTDDYLEEMWNDLKKEEE